jgi:alkylation response protein AidB-like acyl-CoA dehydrogenase
MIGLMSRPVPGPDAVRSALERIAAAAAARDAAPERRFPADAFAALRDSGALGANATVGALRPPAAGELSLVRRVAAADGSVGRIFDGHLNAVERLAVYAPPALRDAELAAVDAGELLAGVWGGDPVGDEGPPATAVQTPGGPVLRGVKTFCSGAGGLQRAAVLARSPDATAPVLVWIDVGDERRVEIDESWYRAAGLVASVSHRVVFHDAPVLASLGGPGAIADQPWFGRDALRTAASWAGMADTAVRASLTELALRPQTSELEALAAGRILAHRATIDAWLSTAAAAMDGDDGDLGPTALNGRVAIADCCRQLLAEAALACGSRPFARGSDLDRARRDLELFLLQHRLEPMLARAGRAALRGSP